MAAKTTILSGGAIVCCAVLFSARAGAHWWSHAPVDFEDCAASAEKDAASADDKDKRLTACEAKFAGRRKPGGGYTYYDFMQNRHFDIAGPNPTPAEQKQIDEQYTVYLNDQRRSIIAAAFLQKQQQIEQARTGSGDVKPRLPNPNVASGDKANPRAHVAVLPRPRPRFTRRCGDDFFASCHWPRISSGVRDLKKALFGSFTPKDVRG